MDVLKRFYYSELIFKDNTDPVLRQTIEKGVNDGKRGQIPEYCRN